MKLLRGLDKAGNLFLFYPLAEANGNDCLVVILLGKIANGKYADHYKSFCSLIYRSDDKIIAVPFMGRRMQ